MKRRNVLMGGAAAAVLAGRESIAMAKAAIEPNGWQHRVVRVDVSPGLSELIKVLDRETADGSEVVAILGDQGQKVVLRSKIVKT
jgi:hypothetical protein